MKLQEFPWYCGGKLLLGLTDLSSFTQVQFSSRDSYCPSGRGDFAWMLDQLFTAHNYVIGTAVGVTNSSQKVAAKYLEDLGFVMAAETDKTGSYGRCKTWVGDVRLVVRKRILEVLAEEGEKIGLKSYVPVHLRPKTLSAPKPKPAPKKLSLFSDRDV